MALRDIPDYPAALDQLQKAFSLAPADATVHLLLGLTYQDLNELDEAETSFNQALQLDPESVEIKQSLGLLLAQQGRYEDAIKFLRSVAATDIHNLPVQQALASALEHTDQRKAAIEILWGVLEHFPDEVKLAAQLGRLLLEDNQPEPAIKVLTLAVEKQPDADMICDLSAGYAMLGDYQQAFDILKQAVDITPEYDRVWRGIAYCQLNLGFFDEAIPAAQKAIDLNDEHFRNWQVQAETLEVMGQSEKAFEALQQAINLARQTTSGKAVLRKLLADRIMARWKSEKAEVALTQIEQDKHDFPEYLSVLLSLEKVIFFSENQYEQALTTIQQLEGMGIPKADLFNDYFRAYYGLGKPAEAQAILQEALNSERNREEILGEVNQVAIQFYQRGRSELARVIIEQLITMTPEESSLRNNLAFILMGEKKWDEAEAIFNKILEEGATQPELALTNLSYIRLHQKSYAEAVELLEKAQTCADEKSQSILHIACWYKGGISESPGELFPKRFTSTLLAVRANLATAYYLNGQVSEAFEAAHGAIAADPHDNIGYRVLGCLELTEDNIEGAREAWQHALQRERSRSGTELIQSWLADLPVSIG